MDTLTSLLERKYPGKGGGGGGGILSDTVGTAVDAKERAGEGGIGGSWLSEGSIKLAVEVIRVVVMVAVVVVVVVVVVKIWCISGGNADS